MTDNFVMAQPDPPHKGVVRFNKLCVAQSRDGDQDRTGAEGGTKTRLTFSQSCFALAQFLFRSLADGDVDADGLKELPAAKLDGSQKYFNWQFSSIPAQDDPFETSTAVD